MGINLVVVTKEMVKPMLLWNARGIATTRAPLPKATRGVVLLFQHRCNALLLSTKRRAAVIRPHRCMPRVFTRHETASQRRANWRGSQRIGKAKSLLGHLVNPWRFHVGVSHMAQLEIGQLIRHHVDDVRWTVLSRDRDGQGYES